VAGASGIPNRTAIYATIDASAYGNDQTDATAAIQSALNNCPANEVVYIPAGTYLIKGSISIPSNVTLRGAGPTLTILDARTRIYQPHQSVYLRRGPFDDQFGCQLPERFEPNYWRRFHPKKRIAQGRPPYQPAPPPPPEAESRPRAAKSVT
jgi:Pectate lyase superfamily protein